jgi:hypothetical protein
MKVVIYVILSLCGTAEVLNVIRIIKIFITIIKIVVPILLVITAMTNYTKAVTTGDLQKPNKALINQMLAAIIIFLVPTVVNVVINVAWADSEVNQCLRNATSENIANVRIENTNDLISKLEKNLNATNYNQALASAKKIEDAETKKEMIEKIQSYEKYVNITKEIDELEQNYTKDQYKTLYSQVESIANDDIRESLLARIEEIGGKPLNIDSGEYSDSQSSLTYKVYVPNDVTTKMPLIMYLHGDGGGETLMYNMTKKVYGDDFPFILVAPIGGMWAETSGRISELKSIIDTVCKKYSCDTSRISIAGHSRGAIGTWAMVNAYPKLFYSAVPVSCGGSITASNFKNTKVKAFCGNTGDDITYYKNMLRNVNAINKAGGNAKIVQLNTDHNGAPKLAFTKDTIEWMIN